MAETNMAETETQTTTTPNPDEEFKTGQVLTVVGGHFTHDTSSAFYAPLIPLIQEKLSLSYSAVGFLAMIMQLPGLLTPFIGYLADRLSVRFFVIFAPAVTATLMSLIGLAPNYLSLVFMLLATGVSVAAFHAPSPAMIANVSGKRLGTGMGLYMAGGELGRTVGPLIVAGSVAWFGLEGMWRLMFVGWAVSGILYFRLKDVAAKPRINTSFPWKQSIRLFSILSWILLTRAFFISAISTFLPSYMSDVVGAPFWLAAGALSILEAAGVAGALLSGTLSDQFGRRGILLILIISSPLILFIFLISPAWAYIPLLLLLGFTSLATGPVLLAIVQESFPNDRALANGIFMALNLLLLGLGLFLTGVIADQIGLRTTYFVAGLISFASIPAVLQLKN